MIPTQSNCENKLRLYGAETDITVFSVAMVPANAEISV